MSLGQTISRLRMEHRLTQDDLAGRLDVSRQSVSKWETDASVPELEKLVRIADLFGVSLDALVREEGRSPETAEEAPAADRGGDRKKREEIPVRRMVLGGVLLVVGLLGQLILLFLAGWDALLLGLLFTGPFIACGLICLKARRRAGLWCFWAVYVLQQLYWTYATGITWKLILLTPHFEPEMNYLRLAVGWAMFLAILALMIGTMWSFRKGRLAPGRKAVLLTVGLWLLCVVLNIPFAFPSGGNEIMLLLAARQIIRLAALTAAVTVTLAALRGARTQRA